MSLWYPTYVTIITDKQEQASFDAKCQINFTNFEPGAFRSYCGCNASVFEDVVISDVHLDSWMVGGATFSNVTFKNVTFDNVLINSSQFVHNCAFQKCSLNNSKFVQLSWNDVSLDTVFMSSSDVCDLQGVNVSLTNPLVVYNTSINGRLYSNQTSIVDSADLLIDNATNSTCGDSVLEDFDHIICRTPDSFKVYRDSFFVSASALPGNIASAIAVYFLRRNYWLGK